MMSKFNDLLNLRFKQKETQQPKMTALVERSNNGDLSSFSGVFRVSQLNEKEKADIESILRNFLQYYEFYSLLPQTLHPKLDQMPRQAVYSLASRNGPLDRKETIVKNYTGQAKEELLRLIRVEFPLPEDDKRLPHFSTNAISFLKRARDMLKNVHCHPSEEEKRQIQNLINQLQSLVK